MTDESSTDRGTRRQGEIDNQTLLKDMRNDYHRLSNDFSEWKQNIREEKKGIYYRLNSLEEKALYIPSAEESELIKEASAYYKSKREFKEKLQHTLMEKGITGLVLFILAASGFYIKHLLTEGP